MWTLQLGSTLDDLLHDIGQTIANLAMKSIAIAPPSSPSALNTLADTIFSPPTMGGWGIPYPLECRAKAVAFSQSAGLNSPFHDIRAINTNAALSTPVYENAHPLTLKNTAHPALLFPTCTYARSGPPSSTPNSFPHTTQHSRRTSSKQDDSTYLARHTCPVPSPRSFLQTTLLPTT